MLATVPTPARRAFTLIEMLVTVGLVTLLMLAVTQIFSIASRTIGGGQALNAAVRDAQAAQAVFARDFGAIANASPAFLISMNHRFAYRNRADVAADADGNVRTIDLDADGATSSPGEDLTANTGANFFTYANRSYRQDAILVFTRGLYQRQTGSSSLVSDMSSNEAMIVYGHLSLANNTGGYGATPYTSTLPGVGDATSNPNNFFATQWSLGRSVILLKDLGSSAEPRYIRDSGGLEPLAAATESGTSTGLTGVPDQLASSRYDLADTTITDSNANFIAATKDNAATSLNNNPTENNFHTWFWPLPGFDFASSSTRMRANPFLSNIRDAASLSQQVPIFVPACSQFIVEFAGDFVTQNWDPNNNGIPDEPADIAMTNDYGRVRSHTVALPQAPDGRIDTVFDFANNRHTGQVRWYGMPRDTSNDGRIIANDGDVVPVRDVAGRLMPFERQLPDSAAFVSPANYAVVPPYLPNTTGPAAPRPVSGDYATITPSADPKYVVAWPPQAGDRDDPVHNWTYNRPKMVRIVMNIDRPEGEGRLPEGQSFEYVFNLGF